MILSLTRKFHANVKFLLADQGGLLTIFGLSKFCCGISRRAYKPYTPTDEFAVHELWKVEVNHYLV